MNDFENFTANVISFANEKRKKTANAQTFMNDFTAKDFCEGL